MILSSARGTVDALPHTKRFGVPSGPLSTKRKRQISNRDVYERKTGRLPIETLKVTDRDDKNRRRRPRAEDQDVESKVNG